VLVIHADVTDMTTVSIRNVTADSDVTLLRTVGGLAGYATAWSPDGRYAAVFTGRPITVAGQDHPGREVSAWILDTVAVEAWVVAYTYDAVPGRTPQEYAGVFAPDGATFAWEAGGTLYVAPVARAD